METKIGSKKTLLVIVVVVCIVLVGIFFYVKPTLFSEKKSVGVVPLLQFEKHFPKHPGTITVKNLFDNTEKNIVAENFPASDQFVYYKDGKEARNPGEANSAIPILREEIFPLSKTGEPTSLDKAAKIQMKEYGAEGLLRERTIDVLTNAVLPPPKIPIITK